MAALGSLVTPQTVEAERRHRLSPDLLPAVLVYLTGSEYQEDLSIMGRPYEVESSQTLSVELHAAGGDGKTVSETIDQLELEVEQALGADTTLGGLLENLIPSASEVESSVEQENVIAVRAVTYIAMWRHAFGAPDTPEG